MDNMRGELHGHTQSLRLLAEDKEQMEQVQASM